LTIQVLDDEPCLFGEESRGPLLHMPSRPRSAIRIPLVLFSGRAIDHVVVLEHSLLLGGPDAMADIVVAVDKIRRFSGELAGLEVGRALAASIAKRRE
jgi:hypothetical protein